MKKCFIPFFRPRSIDNLGFFARTKQILARSQFTNAGPNVLELERKIADVHKVRHCVAVCNGTIGIQLVLKGLDLTGEVITTPFTFVATTHAITWQKLTPVFCDIDANTLTISPESIKKLITPKTSAILGVHVFGQICDVDSINEISKKHNLRVVYDAAHSFMTSRNRLSVGNFGDAEVLSFHATKIFHTFEGGAILTNNSELADRLRLLKNFGFNGIDSVGYIGINAKMNEVSAAYGLSLLPYMNDTIAKIGRIHSVYRRLLKKVRGISFFELSKEIKGNNQYLVIFIDEKSFGLTRDQLWAFLWDKGVETRRYFYPGVHMCEPYRFCRRILNTTLPATQKITEKILCLPSYYDLKDEDIHRVSSLMHEASLNKKLVKQWYKSILKASNIAPHLAHIVKSLR